MTAQPREAGPTDADRETARVALAFPAVRDDIERVAAALAAAREDERRRVVEPFEKLAAEWDRENNWLYHREAIEQLEAVLAEVAGRAGKRGGDVSILMGRVGDCPQRDEHRPPQGPNEDVAQCWRCGALTYAMRPWGETFGTHIDDCALPIWHRGYCVPGGDGHPEAPVIRG